MNDENFRHAADNAVLLLFARVAQIILVPLMAMLLAWTFSTLNSLQLDSAMLRGEVGKAIAVSEANNRLLARITDDLDRRVNRLEERLK